MLEELSERARRLRNDPELEITVRKGICGTCLQSDARQGAKWCVAENTSLCEARQDETDQEAVWTITQRPGVGVHESNHFRESQKADEWSLRLWRGTVTVSSGHWRGTLASSQKAID